MSGEADKRTLDGCRKKVERLNKKGVASALLLKAFYKVCLKASSLQVENMVGLSKAELMEAVDAVSQEGATFPIKVKLALLGRKTTQLLEEKRFAELLACIAPFHGGTFLPNEPSLGAAQPDSYKRCQKFQRMIFKEVLCGMLLDAENKKGDILCFIQLCLDTWEKLDLVEVEHTEALCMDESISIWRALQALLSTSLDAQPMVAYWGVQRVV